MKRIFRPGCLLAESALDHGGGSGKGECDLLKRDPEAIRGMIDSNLTGALLPLFFQKLHLDPALMSNPFVAGLSDTIGTFIYMLLALLLIAPLYP